MGTKFLRLVSALFALALIASACGGAATETAATDEETAAAELAVEENAAAEAAAEQTAVQEATVDAAAVEQPAQDTTAVVAEPPVDDTTPAVVEEPAVEEPVVEEPTAEPEVDLSVAAVFAAGNVTLDADQRIEASVGDVVTLTIDSDVTEEVHLHGYEIFADVVPGETTTVTFTADTPGRFEIEFETSHAFIAELVVS